MSERIWFVMPGPLGFHEDGSIKTESMIKEGVEIPSWMDLRGRGALVRGTYFEREVAIDEDDITILKVFPSKA